LGRFRDLLLFLFEQREGFIDSLSETICCSWAATQVRRHHYVDLDTLAVRWPKEAMIMRLRARVVGNSRRARLVK
jgi:hypothetical protein